MDQGRRKRLVFSIALCISAACRNAERPAWPRPTSGQAAPPAPRVTTTDDLVVYLDTSMSIQGYVQADGSTIYGKTLRELRNFSTAMSRPLHVTVRRVDAAVSASTADVELNRASMNRSVYSGLETNLAGAFAQFGPAVTAAGAVPLQAAVPALQLLVTDGVQSTDGPASVDCAEGSDQICVRNQLVRWINSGWSAALLGIRSEFDGTIYSEINHRTPGRPYSIQYASNHDDVRTYRPFYIYALSPDERTLTEFVAKLKRRLQAADHNLVLRELPLNIRYTTGQAMALVKVDPNARQVISVEGARQSPDDRLTIRLNPRTDHPTPNPIVLRVSIPWSVDAADMGSKKELARSLAWDVVTLDKRTGKEERRPILTVGSATVNEDGTIDVPIDPHWPPGTGNLTWTVQAIRARLNYDEDAPQWVRDWSTDLDTSAAYGNRTLFLEGAVLGLWRNAKTNARSVGEIYIRLGP
jgi:hypothetical protein